MRLTVHVGLILPVILTSSCARQGESKPSAAPARGIYATPADVFVVTGGGLGTIGLKSAVRFGDAVEFTLTAPLCLNGPADIKNTTFFIGLAAAAAPMHVTSQMSVVGATPIYGVDARVPTHPVAPDPPGGL